MDVELRPPREDEVRAFFDAASTAFGDVPETDEDLGRFLRVAPGDRFLCALDGGAVVGTAAAYPFRLTVPGGELPAAGVSAVGVLPTHRRRGIATRLMRRQLEDVRARGEPLAALWATEAAIYGNFGYGLATLGLGIDVDPKRVVFRDRSAPSGQVRLLRPEEALELLPPVYDRVRVETPGFFARSRDWWEARRLADPERSRRGGGPMFRAFVELDGRGEAYAIYRIHEGWQEGIPDNRLEVLEALGTSALARREIWRFLLGVDLIARVRVARRLASDDPLFLMVTDARGLHVTVGDALWLRIVEVEAALAGRSYAGEGSVVVEVRDDLLPENEGRFAVSASGAARTQAEPDLRLDVADLASAYLGGFTFAELWRAGRVEEHAESAVARADALFRTDRAPWCPELF